MTTTLIDNVRALTADPQRPGIGLIDDAAVAIENGLIAWVGARSEIPSQLRSNHVINGQGRLLTPGLVDCHTHLPFGGDRADEFAMRAGGADYSTIAAAGGGILSTVRATIAMTDGELAAIIAARAKQFVQCGVTTIEAKSGYELTAAGELRTLRAIAAARALSPAKLHATLLAHVVPMQARDSNRERAAWIDTFVRDIIEPAAQQQLATSVDVYCDDGAYTLNEATALWRAAKACGLEVRGHIGQFTDVGAATLLAELGARSADHLEFISATGAQALARAGTIAVMIPTACVQLRQAPPPVAMLRNAGVNMAIASDFNPGTSYAIGLATSMWLATTHFGMTVDEAWLGVTRHAATALGCPDIGQIVQGFSADVTLWDATSPAAIPYSVGQSLVAAVWSNGIEVARQGYGV
jgi:imidazolonepropionase